MAYDWISFTTDYGSADGFTAACEGVIARIAPAARVIHLSHRVPAQDIRRGAAVLAQTVPYLPPCIHLAVVDPGVGTARRPIALDTGNGILVGPDNGLLIPAAEVLGGVRAAVELTRYRLESVSATFHGRDIFAPAAAHLAAGVPIAELGPAVAPETLVRLLPPETRVAPGRLDTELIGVDTFGNLQFAATAAHLLAAGAHPGSRVHVLVGGRSIEAVVGETFADVRIGDPVVLIDSAGQVALAVNGRSAESVLGGQTGTNVILLVARP